jgi:plastocyanin
MCGVSPDRVVAARKPATHTVTIDASRFQPDTMTVMAGDTVVWRNEDLVAHTATSKAGAFDSGLIAPGKSWTYKPKRAGDFSYTCTYHPTMTGTLRVK